MKVCRTCGSDQVEVLAWVDANTHEFNKIEPLEAAWLHAIDAYCRDCCAPTGLVEKEEPKR